MKHKASFYKPVQFICYYIPQRWLLSIMCSLAVVNAYTMRMVLNIAITVMVKRGNYTGKKIDPDACPMPISPAASGVVVHEGEFLWSEAEQGMLLSAFFWGYVLTHIPGGLLATRFGGKYVLSIGILITAIFTLLTPLAASNGSVYWMILIRFMEGLGEGPTFPAISVLLAHWSPPHEKSRHASLAYAGSLIGNVIGHILSGLVLHATGNDWPLVFYMFGTIAIVWVLLFWVFCFSTPDHHPYLGSNERAYLKEHLAGVKHGKAVAKVPWKAVLTSVPVWGLVVAQIGHDWIFFSMVTDLPKYMNDVMRFNIRDNGIWSAMPYLAEFVVSLLAGWIADKVISKKWLSVTNTRKLFTTLASVFPSIGIIVASYSGCDKVAVVVWFTVAMGVMGTFYPGIKVNVQDLSPNFAGILMSLVNGIGAMSGMIVPFLIGVMTKDSTLMQWRTVFWMVAAVTVATNIVFVLTADGNVQPWNEIKSEEEEPSTPDA